MAEPPTAGPTTGPTTGPTLRADCGSCFALCCVAHTLTRSTDFAIDKPAGVPCLHLAEEHFGCTIHDELRPRGFPGCTTYDCFGAGQRVAQHTYAGTSWRADPGSADQMFRVFAVVRVLHELLWLLAQAADLPSSGPLLRELDEARARTERWAEARAGELEVLDVGAQRDATVPLLRQASALARAEAPGPDLDGADLLGTDLRSTDLRGASLRGALLVGVDLRGADLRLADLTGADLRGADVRGADLGRALFLSQAQVAATRGDLLTTVPPGLERPAHWPAASAHPRVGA